MYIYIEKLYILGYWIRKQVAGNTFDRGDVII
jgi:hypothetical protein